MLKGIIVHTMLAEWYRSGVVGDQDTRVRDTDRAVQAGELDANQRLSEFTSPERHELILNECSTIMRSYASEYHDEQLQVVCDSEGPLIERELVYPLDKRHVFTCRLDGVVLDTDGLLKTLEHKTAAYPGGRFKAVPMEAQFSGEQWILEQKFPGALIGGTLVNVLGTKNHVGDFERQTTSRTKAQLERWQQGCIRINEQIAEAKQGFELDQINGVPEETAANRWFPDHGTRTDYCTQYSGCDYLDLCQWAGREVNQLGQFRSAA